MNRHRFRSSLLVIAILASFASFAADIENEDWGSEEDWGDDAWSEESVGSGPQISGFVDAGFGLFLRDSNPAMEDESLAEVRLRLETSHYFGEVFSSLKIDLTGDAVTDETDAEVREAF